MEVHHHPDLHHKKKKWKEYLLEFLMIFLAVTLGFFAETIREKISEKHREKDYIIGLINNIQNDTSELKGLIKRNDLELRGIDSLMKISKNKFTNLLIQDSMFFYALQYTQTLFLFQFNDLTLVQLRNAGGFSVIHRQEIIDSIGLFYSFYQTALKFNGNYYNEYYNKMVQFAAQVMDLPVIPLTTDDSLLKMVPHHVEVFTRYDMTLLRELYSIIRYVKGCLLFYMKQEKTYGEMAERMIDYLAKKYDIKNE